jgi:Flp pilus assembly protein TadB
MRWLLMVLLVSLAALLIAAAGVTHYVWAQRRRNRNKPSAGAGTATGPADETDIET